MSTEESVITLHWVDYLVFGLFLLTTSAFGVYSGYAHRRSQSVRQYLLAGRSMHWGPLCFSLVASYLSAITLLGVASEVYSYGLEYCCLLLSYVLLVCLVSTIYAPIFYRLKLTSVNEYLGLRFSSSVRTVGFIVYTFAMIVYLGVVLFAPSLALYSVAKVPISYSILASAAVSIFYATVGGIKAVIWADVFQCIIMVSGLIVVIVVGSSRVGGMSEVWDIASRHNRTTIFDFDPDPLQRNSFWTLAIGGVFTALPMWSVGQAAVQRFGAARSLKHCRIAVWLSSVGLTTIVSLCVLDGLVIYAYYYKCDLLIDKKITRNDEALPYFVIHVLGTWKGLPGLFVACLYSGALSTAASGLNALAAVTLQDFVKRFWPSISDARATTLSKALSVAYGLVILAMAFAAEHLGKFVLQLAYSIFGILLGPLLGMFTLGMMCPWAKAKSTVVGVLCGISLMMWINSGAMTYRPWDDKKVVRTFGCTNSSLAALDSISFKPPVHNDPLASFYSLSYLWYAATGIFSTILVGSIGSVFEGLVMRRMGTVSRPVDKRLMVDYSRLKEVILDSICCRADPADTKQIDEDHHMALLKPEHRGSWLEEPETKT